MPMIWVDGVHGTEREQLAAVLAWLRAEKWDRHPGIPRYRLDSDAPTCWRFTNRGAGAIEIETWTDPTTRRLRARVEVSTSTGHARIWDLDSVAQGIDLAAVYGLIPAGVSGMLKAGLRR